MIKSPEIRTIDLVFNKAVEDLEFQSFLVRIGILRQDPQPVIDCFRKAIDSICFSDQERKTLEAHEPFGFLNTYERVATQVYGYSDWYTRHACHTNFTRALARLKDDKNYPNPPITIYSGRATKLRGIGYQTNLTDGSLALAYCIPRLNGGDAVFYYDLADRLRPEDREIFPQEERSHLIRVMLNRLEERLSPGLLIRTKNYRLGSPVSFRWAEKAT